MCPSSTWLFSAHSYTSCLDHERKEAKVFGLAVTLSEKGDQEAVAETVESGLTYIQVNTAAFRYLSSQSTLYANIQLLSQNPRAGQHPGSLSGRIGSRSGGNR